MSSAEKALELLSYFSDSRPEIGLTQLHRLANRDKATTYRHLQALENAGFVEQNPLTKNYRIGPAVLQLAQIREATLPRKAAALEVLLDLAETTGETAHATVLSGTSIHELASCESKRHSTRAIMDITTFPLHATASGICALAFGPDALFKVACDNLKAFTSSTAQTPAELEQVVRSVRETGFADANRSFEADIYGVAAPLYDQSGIFAGTVAVASVAARYTPQLEQIIRQNLIDASRRISKSWGGTIPEEVESLWAKALTAAEEKVTTS